MHFGFCSIYEWVGFNLITSRFFGTAHLLIMFTLRHWSLDTVVKIQSNDIILETKVYAFTAYRCLQSWNVLKSSTYQKSHEPSRYNYRHTLATPYDPSNDGPLMFWYAPIIRFTSACIWYLSVTSAWRVTATLSRVMPGCCLTVKMSNGGDGSGVVNLMVIFLT